jgi:hypothetical protein
VPSCRASCSHIAFVSPVNSLFSLRCLSLQLYMVYRRGRRKKIEQR